MHLQMLKPWTEFKSMWFECNVTLARFYEEKTLFYSKSNCVQLRYIRCCASPKNRHKPSTDYQTRSSGSWIVIRTMQLWRVAHTASVASLARLSSMVMMIHACARPYLLQYSAGILGAWCKKHPHQWTNEQRAYAFYPICTWLTVTKIIMCGHGFGGRLICYTVPVLGHSNSVGHYHLLRVGFFFFLPTIRFPTRCVVPPAAIHYCIVRWYHPRRRLFRNAQMHDDCHHWQWRWMIIVTMWRHRMQFSMHNIAKTLTIILIVVIIIMWMNQKCMHTPLQRIAKASLW